MANKLTIQQLNDKFTAAIQDSSNFIKESKNYAASLFKKGTRSGTEAVLYFDGAGEIAVSADDAENNMSVSGMSGDVKQYAVKLKVGNAKGKIAWTAIEEAFKLGSVDEDLVKPTANALAEKLVKEVIKNSAFRSTGVVVASSASFAPLASAAASLRKMRTGMSLVGHMDSDTAGALAALPVVAGNNHFDAPSQKLAELYGDAAIGTFHKVAYVDEPFMTTVTTGASCGSNCLVNGAVTQSAVTDGADTMDIAIDGIAAGVSKIKAGSVFTVSGVNRCTASGTELVNTPYHFVVQADADVASNAATLKVLPVYFSGAGYIPTVGVSSIADNSAITWITGANKTYNVTIVRAREALNWTPIEMPDIRNCENGKTTTQSLSVHTAFDGDFNNATNMGRLDCLFSGKIVDPRLVRTIYWEV